MMLLVGNLKNRETAEKCAKMIADWLTLESGWKMRVQ
jgi:hypothetical protein